MSPIKFPTKRLLPNFHILQITKMMSFCNLERPSYFKPIYFILSKVADEAILRNYLREEPGLI